MRRRELFPADPVLVARMAFAILYVAVVVAGAIVAVALSGEWRVQAGVAVACLIGAGAAASERSKRRRAAELSPVDAPELHATVERLCLAADIAKPRVVLEAERQPNSWVGSLGRGHSQLHVTQGLLDTLDGPELEAVIAHEIAHVAHRDAAVMTVVGGPASALLSGGVGLFRDGGIWFLMVGGAVATVIGWVGSLGTRALSRYREFAADAGAVALTGNPAALASALTKISDGLVAIPKADLRAAAGRDAFHLVPVGKGRDFLPGTHPPLRTRIARLERMEARLHAARPAVRHQALEPLH